MGASPRSARLPGLPAGPKGTRGAILVELKRSGSLTAREAAVRLGCSLNGVRHHLRELEADGFVSYERRHKGVGAPVFVYRLTAAAEALFPRRYEATLLECLDHVVEREGRAAAVQVLEGHFATLERRLAGELAGAPVARRLEVVAEALAGEGYMAEASVGGGGSVGTLTEHNCAVRAVVERFPELCAAEARFLESVIGAPVERRAHVLSGCGCCEYHVKLAGGEGVEENA